MSGPQHRPRYADVVGTLALLVAMSGTAYAAHALPKNSVSSKQIKDNKVMGRDLKDGGVTSADLAVGSVGGAQLQAGSVGNAQLQPGSVGNAQLAASSVGMAKLADNAIGSTQVANNTLTLADLKGGDFTGGVSASVVANGCKVLDFTVPGAELGDAGFLTWRTPPPNLLFGPVNFDGTDQAAVLVCNPTGTAVTINGASMRIVTFRS
jgi:hypothetical protein